MPQLLDGKCACDWPVLWEVGSPSFVGRLVTIRLCCFMTYIEQRDEIDFHETKDTEPTYTWNVGATGLPVPDYMAQRIAAKKAAGFSMEAPLEPSLMTRLADLMRDDPDALNEFSLDQRRGIVDILARTKGVSGDISGGLTNEEQSLIRRALHGTDLAGNVSRPRSQEATIRESEPVTTGNRSGLSN